MGICDDTGAGPHVSEEVIWKNGWYRGGGYALHCDIGSGRFELFFYVCSSLSLDGTALTCLSVSSGCVAIPVHLPIQSRSRGGNFITVVPCEQQVTPSQTFGSLQAIVPVGGQGIEIVRGRHPRPITDFYASSNSELFAPARAKSELCHYVYTGTVSA
jgi:hypothetical protein